MPLISSRPRVVAFALATHAAMSESAQRGERERMLKLKSAVPTRGILPRHAYVNAVEMAPDASRCKLRRHTQLERAVGERSRSVCATEAHNGVGSVRALEDHVGQQLGEGAVEDRKCLVQQSWRGAIVAQRAFDMQRHILVEARVRVAVLVRATRAMHAHLVDAAHAKGRERRLVGAYQIPCRGTRARRVIVLATQRVDDDLTYMCH
jgi:hypothetical protein